MDAGNHDRLNRRLQPLDHRRREALSMVERVVVKRCENGESYLGERWHRTVSALARTSPAVVR